MRWDFGWHHHEERTIDVFEALKLRDEGTLKSGDLYCCPRCVGEEHGVRLHPVDAIVRSKFLRRDPRYNENTIRPDCIKQKESRQKGESWKHTRVVDAIEYMFSNENLLADIRFSRFERVPGKEGVDFDLFDENNNNSKLIVVLRNLRRARSIKRMNPNVKILYIHRWREADVDFFKYIKDRVIQTFDATNSDDFLEHVEKTFAIPCIGLRPERSKTNPLVGRGMVVNITPELEEQSFEAEQLQTIEYLVERVQEHNMWAISTPGEHRYDTKHLSFQPFSGAGKHPDPAVDAILSVLSDPSNHPGIKFHQYPDQAKLRKDFLENEELLNKTISHIIEEVKADGELKIPPEDDLREYLKKDLTDSTNREVDEIELRQSEHEVAREDAEAWAKDGLTKKMVKMFHESIMRTTSREVIEFNVDGEWYAWTQTDENPSAYDILRHAAVLDAPQLLAPWGSLSEDSRKKCLKGLKKLYKERTYVAGLPYVLTPLVDIKLGQNPNVLTDPYGLVSRLFEMNNEEHIEFSPLKPDELNSLCFYLSADKTISAQDPKHPSFLDLMWATNASTEHLQRSVNLKLPQPIEDMLNGKDDAGMEILDLMAQGLVNQQDTNE